MSGVFKTITAKAMMASAVTDDPVKKKKRESNLDRMDKWIKDLFKFKIFMTRWISAPSRGWQ